MRYRSLSPFLQPQILFTTNEPQSYVFGGRNHPLHSNSQKSMLEDYAHRNGFPNPTHFTDDGISGTRFDRPGFTAMMEEVEAGNVEAIIIKDDCVIIELNAESPIKCGFCGARSVF